MRDCEGGDWGWGLSGLVGGGGEWSGRVMGGLEGGCRETT